jgi:hypothetical protein
MSVLFLLHFSFYLPRILAGLFWSILHLVSHGKSVLDHLGYRCDITHFQGMLTDLVLSSPQQINPVYLPICGLVLASGKAMKA